MIGEYFRKSYYPLDIALYVFSIAYILVMLGGSKEPTDYIIIQRIVIDVTLNQAFLIHISRRNHQLSQGKDLILMRYSVHRFLEELLRNAFYETVLMILTYVLLVIVLGCRIYSFLYYGIYLVIMFLLLYLYQMISISSMFIKRKLLRSVVIAMPFIINLVMAVYFFAGTFSTLFYW